MASNGYKRLLIDYKNGANKRKMEISLTYEQFENLVKQDCFYCGVNPSFRTISRGAKKIPATCLCNGIDRKDNSTGYTPENCIPCCSICNRAKRSLSYEDFLVWLDRIAQFQKRTEIEII